MFGNRGERSAELGTTGASPESPREAPRGAGRRAASRRAIVRQTTTRNQRLATGTGP